MVLPWLEWYSLKDWRKDLYPVAYASAQPVAGGIRLTLRAHEYQEVLAVKFLEI